MQNGLSRPGRTENKNIVTTMGPPAQKSLTLPERFAAFVDEYKRVWELVKKSDPFKKSPEEKKAAEEAHKFDEQVRQFTGQSKKSFDETMLEAGRMRTVHLHERIQKLEELKVKKLREVFLLNEREKETPEQIAKYTKDMQVASEQLRQIHLQIWTLGQEDKALKEQARRCLSRIPEAHQQEQRQIQEAFDKELLDLKYKRAEPTTPLEAKFEAWCRESEKASQMYVQSESHQKSLVAQKSLGTVYERFDMLTGHPSGGKSQISNKSTKYGRGIPHLHKSCKKISKARGAH